MNQRQHILGGALTIKTSGTFSAIGKSVVASHHNPMHSKCCLWPLEKSVLLLQSLPFHCCLSVLTSTLYPCPASEIVSGLSFPTPTLLWPWECHVQFQRTVHPGGQLSVNLLQFSPSGYSWVMGKTLTDFSSVSLMRRSHSKTEKPNRGLGSSLKFTVICTRYSFICQSVIFHTGIIPFHFMSSPANYIL